MSAWSRSSLSGETMRTSFQQAWEALSKIIHDTQTDCTVNEIVCLDSRGSIHEENLQQFLS